LQGSPARVCGSGDAVFGDGPAAALDLTGCLHEMIKLASNQLGVPIKTDPNFWIVTRVDITQNIMLDTLQEVIQALGYLRSCEGGRYKVTAQSGDTVYWSNRSKLRKGKAYAKGPHIQYMIKQKTYTGYNYTPSQQLASNKLLRLEETLGCKYFDRQSKIGIKWHQITPQMLKDEWHSYFNRMIGTAEMTIDTDIRTILEQSAPTPGQGRAAHGCWLLIQHEGWHKARQSYSDRTWYRHMKILHHAGLGDMDISSGKVVPLRLKILEARQVNTWHDLIAA
jgi:II/X family phage/plasmid replication protein